MLQPIYNQRINGELASGLFKAKKNNSHSGLWFEKFYAYKRYDSEGRLLPEGEQKDAKISEKNSFWDDFKGVNGVRRCGSEEKLNKHALHQYELCQAQGGISRVYANDWLMAIGLGNSHPLENGLLWHPTLGVPYFQGATVKGLAKALMEEWGADPKLIKRWFGSVNLLTSPNYKDKSAAFSKYFATELTESLKASLVKDSTGVFIFLDATPVEPVMIKKTIVTAHYGKWYEKGDDMPTASDVLPGDWHSPVPVEFLTVESAVMQFGVMPRLGADVQEGEIEQMANVIQLALEHLGIGAKTATGFGRMHLDNKKHHALKQQFKAYAEELKQQIELAKSLEGASELKQALVKQVSEYNWRETNDVAKHNFTQAINEWLEKLEAQPDDKESIELMYEIALVHYQKQISKPAKAKPHQKEWIDRLEALRKSD